MNIGILLPAIEQNQLTFDVINAIERDLKIGKHQFTLFYENASNTRFTLDCSVCSAGHIPDFEGLLITTTLRNTLLCSKFAGPVKKRFLIWDMEWIRGKKNFIENISILRNPNIELIARSFETSQLIQNYCNRKVYNINSNLDFEKML